MKIIFWGGGPANVLLATLLAERQPQHRIEIYEKNETLGGNHTWSFHESSVPKDLRPWLAPFISYSWPGQSVCFSKYERHFESSYMTILSEDLHRMALQKLRMLPNAQLHLGVAAEPESLIQSDIIFDGRGLSGEIADRFNPGFQKFLGVEVELTREHGLKQPLLMDARVPQVDGFRYFYVLPLTNTRVLIEDTYYSNEPRMEIERLRSEIRQYAFNRGWQFKRLIREEVGCLPIPVAAAKRPSVGDPKILATGLRGGFFQ
jgi:lycopene beta-cyclase